MQLNLDRVRENAARATTEDLLDRVTVYRSGMEPEALDIIEAELHRRGIRPRDIDHHAESHRGALLDRAGVALKCVRCSQPAVWQGWVMHKLWGVLPLVPRYVALCAEHRR
jgi:hypothetical protein